MTEDESEEIQKFVQSLVIGLYDRYQHHIPDQIKVQFRDDICKFGMAIIELCTPEEEE